MNEIQRNIQVEAAKHSEPLFLSPPWLQGGHTIEKANGTITYVQQGGEIFGITCAHVYYQQFASEPHKWLTIHGKERYIYQFGTFTQNGYKSHFRPLRMPKSDNGPDIAIVKLDDAFKKIHFERKGKAAIDLDNWTEPNWIELRTPVAFGFPTEHKSEADGFLQCPLAAVVAELTRPISISDDSFLMASSLERENTFYFSGMSGGAVYCMLDSERPIELIGIVFEGFPGSSAEWQSRPNGCFLTANDIQIRAHVITPDIFQTWLGIAGFR
ncbi:MAG TPA: hypothetical protein VK753_01010 [Xanthomonadaceae bacterium]|jgi:hypothetical protein|nr:hypothetical protein [Xanthomonadaceae bacterium]